MWLTLPNFGATSRILLREATTEQAKLLSLLSMNDDNCVNFFSLHSTTVFFKYFEVLFKVSFIKLILPKGRIPGVSLVGECYVKTGKNKKRHAS